MGAEDRPNQQHDAAETYAQMVANTVHEHNGVLDPNHSIIQRAQPILGPQIIDMIALVVRENNALRANNKTEKP